MKKVLATILSVCMMVSVLLIPTYAADAIGYSDKSLAATAAPDDAVDIMQFDASSSQKTYTISSAEGLQKLSEVSKTATSGVDFGGFQFYLTESIDCTSLTGFSGIGSNGSRWASSFYGLGNTIDNLKMSSTSNNTALFPFTTNWGRVYDLHLGSGCSFSGNRFTSAVVGQNYGTSGVIIQNIYSEAAVTGTGSVNGGIVGYDQGAMTIKNCTVAGSVSGTASTGGIVGNKSYALAANLTTTINDCMITKTASINGSGNGAGGIVGLFEVGNTYASTITISSCQNDAKVTTTSGYAGGIVGNITGTNILSVDGCTNNGTVKAWTIAGIVGMSSSDNVTITNCTNRGKLDTTNGGIKEIANGNALTATSGYNLEYAKLAQYEGYQVKSNKVGDEVVSQDIRFLATIDSSNYDRAGFSVTVKRGEEILKTVTERDCQYAYQSVYAIVNGVETPIDVDEDGYRDGGYFIAYSITGIPVEYAEGVSMGELTFEIETYTYAKGATTPTVGESITVTHTIGAVK